MTPQTPKTSTTYVVLQQHEAGVWTERKRVSAASGEGAVRTFAATLSEGGTFVAIPARSFQPIEVKIETVQRVRIGEASAPATSPKAAPKP